ncbi:MAG TPA: Txe/YoeB family addiction module toxin [Porphyromonadaceae bacterium]|nr:Txe/YoeB family addiction module toxin [Porphyromonadaceae bacterium]
MSFIIDFKDEAKRDLEKHQKAGQKIVLKKIKDFTLECQSNPRTGTGKPEQLKYRQPETWSRRINDKHRFVYEIEGQIIHILSVWGHYK